VTVTVVFGKATDGYLHKYNATYATALAGPADGVNGGNSAFLGQNRNASYQVFQTFIGWDYSLIPDTEVVTHAAMRVNVGNYYTPSIARDLEFRGFAWSPSGLQTSDWRTTTQLAASRLDGLVHLLTGVDGKWIYATSDEFLANVRVNTTMDEILVTGRQRAGTTPTQDEGLWIYTSESDGTSADPALIYTSAPRSTLFGVMGAQVETSLGHAYLESNGAVSPTITLKHRTWAGTVTTIGTLPIGTAATDFFTPQGLQAFALVKDDTDSLYVIGRAGNADNSLAGRAYTTVLGSGTWTPQTVRSGALPTFGSGINQVAAVFHNLNGGCLFFVAGHIGSAGDSVVHNELINGTINTAHLKTGAGSFLRASGYTAPNLQPNITSTAHFNTWSNETGTGLDLATVNSLSGNEQWGFLASFVSGSIPGDNPLIRPGRYILTATGGGFDHTSYVSAGISQWARKDGAAKIRVVPVSSTAVAYVTTDSDVGYGLSVRVASYSGSNAEPAILGGSYLGGDVANMPDGPAIAQSAAWDAIYNATENRLWIYFVSTANPLQVYRTAFDLNTMQAVQNTVLVYTAGAGNTIQGIRTQRNDSAGGSTLVTFALLNGTTRSTAYTLDTFNIAPTAPTLTPKSNFDASTAQTFAWTFNDPNLPTDTQSAYQLEISNADTGVVALDTGKVASATASRNVAGGTIPNGANYRWRVRTYDALDEVSPWSDYGTFATSAGGTVTITSPAIDYPEALITDDLPISWSTAGTTQAAYRVWLYRGTTLVSDTNWIASTSTTHTVTGMLSDQNHEIRVRVRNGAAVETNTAVRLVKPSFATPEAPILSVTEYPAEGFVLLTVDNPAPGAPVIGTSEEDFETGTVGWTAWNADVVTPSMITHDNTFAHHGTFSLRLTAPGSPGSQMYVRKTSPATPVVAGVRYTARMWVRASTSRLVGAAIDWTDSLGAYVTTSIQAVPVTAGEWYRIEVTGTAPGDGFASFGPTVGTPVAGEYLNLDEVVLTIASDRPDVLRNEILRRPNGSLGAFEVIGTADPDGTFRDYTATAGVLYEYRARGQA
jgi:hypothetical protein